MDKKSLTRAGISRASRAVVLSNSENYAKIKQRIADAPTLFSMLNIEAMAPADCYLVAEVLHADNMKFLGDAEDVLRINYGLVMGQGMLSAPFISGIKVKYISIQLFNC